MPTTRREFLQQLSTVGAGALIASALPVTLNAQTPTRPIVAISSGNGLPAVSKAVEMIREGADALDAVIAGVNIVEDDPNDTSVGYGGLPNEEGVVELDAAVMHGPTHRAGAVAALRNIKNPSKVARLVMERTDHVLLVGEGALRFARAHGFIEENLLTDRAREEWLRWKESLSTKDDWLPPHTAEDRDIGGIFEPFFRHTGTIHCSAIDLKGNISCVTTTSGLAFKIPGRVGDSPIIGAGLYCDNDVGAAGSTGRGEANLINCSSVMVVEFMRQGKSPEQACLDACKRIVEHNRMRRLKDDAGRPTFNVNFYAINKRGEYGAAAIYSGSKYALHDGASARLLDAAYLYKR
ncbi:MAG TPA: N(4)-(beta-N-acetylglucosaminyl)-L-asparaginase [Bacteroidota bacterium]|nr:N(4)-(beta-N-acetylglucosaminyl)-L-asparaginase [Bacteroidota bacterium]